MGSTNAMAVAATLHCLTGCAIGEILGLMIGTAWGLGNLTTIAIAVALAFVFGYALSTLPLLRAGWGLGAALGVVLAADTLSIATMELVDNAGHGGDPGRDGRRPGQPRLLAVDDAGPDGGVLRGLAGEPLPARARQGPRPHARASRASRRSGARRFIPDLATATLVAAITAFMLGGLVVSVADDLEIEPTGAHSLRGTPAAR